MAVTEPEAAGPSERSRPSETVEPGATRWSQPLRWWLGRRVWDRRAERWHHEGSLGLEPVFDAVIAAAAVRPGTVVVDLGCGSGQLSLPLARQGGRVRAVDISPRMIEMLAAQAAEEHLDLTGQVSPIERLELPAASVDVVVSNYAFHHLRDHDKQAVVRAASTWLRSGGLLVVGDMMFGRGLTKRDREIIGSKVAIMLGRGPAGWWRLAKNAVRFGLRVRERPVAMNVWVAYFRSAGLVDVSSRSVVSEAGVVVGRKP
jgi:2-polyprenyl-3-methyl-5-hydroxy-6-metoxy-1,4-benzoquinol methylase